MKRVKILILIIAILMIPRVIYAVDEIPDSPTDPGETNENIDTPTNPDDTQDPDENQNGNQDQNQTENQGQNQNNDQNDQTTNQTEQSVSENNQTSNADNTLKSLSVSSGTISFSSFTYDYNVEIPSNVSSLKVTAVPNDSNATVKYNPSDSVDLKYGETKTISIIVSAEDGTSLTYKVNATRNNLDDKVPSVTKETGLKSLTIEGVQFEFEPDKVSYSISVPNEMEEVVIHYELADSSSTAKIDGDTKLKEGRNKIKIIVTSKDGETKTYTLNITRNKTRINVRNDEEEIIEKINSDDKSNLYVNVNFNEEKIIPKNILEALSKTSKALSYEVLNDNKEIIYSITLSGKDIKNTDDFNYQLSFISDNDDKLVELIKSNKYASILFKNNQNIPGKITLKVYVGDRSIKDYKKINLYKLVNNKLKLVEKKLKVDEGYVELTIDTNDEYVLTNLEKQTKSKTSYTIPVVILLTLLVIIIIGLLLKKKKSKKDKKNNDKSNIEKE